MHRRTYTVRDVNRLYGMHPEQVRRWCRLGRWRAKKVGAEWYIAAQDVDETFDISGDSDVRLCPEAETALDEAMGCIG